MTGDYTRFTFKPKKDYSAVLKQQGRVDLDADFNELIEIVDRRWRSETIDIMGSCVVPNSTENAFVVTPIAVAAPGTKADFSIGIGRMYVDGIQVENHGLAPDQFQADLGELRGTVPYTYTNQPYFPVPPPQDLAATPGTTDLIYIDVWQREVTALGDAELKEIALGGPDTTTRIQTAWQVRALEDVGPHSCGDSITGWDALTAPSAGRLTASAEAPPASEDPCIISPSGGYRGLENRLYRVEIHSTGSIGGVAPAKFKWSRNNATIASLVDSKASTPMTDTSVTVEQIGRDQVLRFEVGNWIEITDDFREFQGLAGHMAQITAIDEANRILTFAPDIPAGFNFNAADSGRHTRVVRWDQTGANVDANNGLLDVVAGPIDIKEDGIRVTFALDPPTGNFKVGDYWVFAARTADGSLDLPPNAPPRGILHHFCKLGFINWGADLESTTFTDCRKHWPPAECDCCTVTVGDGIDSHGQYTDIQKAINALGSSGGLVCIGRGFYPVTETIHVDKSKRNVIIRGMGPATRIAFMPRDDSPQVFMEIDGTDHVRLEEVMVVAYNAHALVRISASQFCRVTDCILVNVPKEGDPQLPKLPSAPMAIELKTKNPSHCEIVHNSIIAAKGVACYSGRVSELLVRDNQMLCTQLGVGILEATGIEIVHNQFRGLPQRAFPDPVLLTREGIDQFQRKVSALFQAAPSRANFQAAGVLLVAGSRVVIRENLITAQVAVLGFLLLDARIEGNEILALVGILVLFTVLLKVEDNFVLGLFAGMIQAGITAALDVTSNEWVGLNGLVWMSPLELLAAFGSLLAGGLNAVGFAGNGEAQVNATHRAGADHVGESRGFGMVVMAKVHRNDFVTFFWGMLKTNSILSGDVSVIDNSFMLCSTAAIEWGGGGRSLFQRSPIVNPRHLIQGNGITVTGTGIITSTSETLIEQNSLQCPRVAVEIDAAACTVKNNVIRGLATQPAQQAGLVILHDGAFQTAITGNQLLQAAGHAILFSEDVGGVTIDDNVIRGAGFTGIGTVSDAVRVWQLRISRNTMEGCQGGAVAIGDAEDVLLLDNTIRNNSPSGTPRQWRAVYFREANGIEIRGNSLLKNATAFPLAHTVGAIELLWVQGNVAFQNNTVRGNGGIALWISAGERANSRVMVQNNHFANQQSLVPLFVRISRVNSLLFEGNQCFRALAAGATSVYDVSLNANSANVSGNHVELLRGMHVSGTRLVVNGNSVQGPQRQPALMAWASDSLILTSNLTTGISGNAGHHLVKVNNVP